MSSSQATIIWQPQPGPQTALIACPIQEVFYGGARGGGKTEASIGDWLQHSGQYGEHAIGVFFRRKFKQLEEVIARTKLLFPQIGAKYNEQKAEWVMPGGGRLKFRYIERDQDAQEYQGHSYTRVYIEEATNFPHPGPIDLLRGTLRSATGVPVGMRLTGNPGGPGHHWVKARYITPCPQGWKIIKEKVKGLVGDTMEIERIFIPSKLGDNHLLTDNDPFYVARLRMTGSEALVKAWLEGNWDIIDGAFFDKWDDSLVLPAGEWLPKIPPHSLRFRAMDWGYARPFSIGWYVVSDGTWGLPEGAVLKYREWYGTNGKPNEGLRWTYDLVAQGVRQREVLLDPDTGKFSIEPVAFGVADPAIFKRDGGPSIAEGMLGHGVLWRKADNQRIPGWAELRRRISPQAGPPMLYFLDTCEHTIRTFPIAQCDSKDPEDLDTEGEDHALDETRYAMMGRPWTQYAAEEEAFGWPKRPDELTINEYIERRRQTRLARAEDGGYGE